MQTILCFGDSNTYGFRPEDHGRYGRETRWTALLSEMLRDKGYKVIEEGENGRTTVFDDPKSVTRNGKTALAAILTREEHIDNAIVMLGTNDCKTAFGASAGEIAKGMETLLSMLKQYDSNMHILLLCPAPMTELAVTDEDFDLRSVSVSSELSAYYRALAESEHCEFLDVGQLTSVGKSDGVHLDPFAHLLLAKALASYFA